MLGDDAPEGSKKRDLFDVLRKETKRLGSVVDDLLGFARPRPLSLAPCDISSLVERAVGQMQIDATLRHIHIEARLAATLPPVPQPVSASFVHERLKVPHDPPYLKNVSFRI